MGFFARIKESISGKKDADYYLSGLDKSKKSFKERLSAIARGFRGIDSEFLEELMVALLQADVGIEISQKILDELENEAKSKRAKEFSQVVEILIDVMKRMYEDHEDHDLNENYNGPTVIFMVGVNGSGKTTTCAKVAKRFLEQDKTVIVAAADTFRAGAIEQLSTWAQRLNIMCIKGKEGGDPSAVLVDACRYATENHINIVLADTAGRLQNKVNLMKELEKMHRVCEREIENAPHEVWLVLDATTGQNGISQAQVFMESTKVSGIVLSKMDGSAKGGIIMAIRDKLNLPVRYIGLGEKLDDLRPFDIETYLYGLCEGLIDND